MRLDHSTISTRYGIGRWILGGGGTRLATKAAVGSAPVRAFRFEKVE